MLMGLRGVYEMDGGYGMGMLAEGVLGAHCDKGGSTIIEEGKETQAMF